MSTPKTDANESDLKQDGYKTDAFPLSAVLGRMRSVEQELTDANDIILGAKDALGDKNADSVCLLAMDTARELASLRAELAVMTTDRNTLAVIANGLEYPKSHMQMSDGSYVEVYGSRNMTVVERLRDELAEVKDAAYRQKHGASGMCCQLRLQAAAECDALRQQLTSAYVELTEAARRHSVAMAGMENELSDARSELAVIDSVSPNEVLDMAGDSLRRAHQMLSERTNERDELRRQLSESAEREARLREVLVRAEEGISQAWEDVLCAEDYTAAEYYRVMHGEITAALAEKPRV